MPAVQQAIEIGMEQGIEKNEAEGFFCRRDCPDNRTF
jgi:hypothetical protein